MKVSQRLIVAIRIVAPMVAKQFKKPTKQIVAECLVAFDALAMNGYEAELQELRKMKDPRGFVVQVLS